jgi:transposase
MKQQYYCGIDFGKSDSHFCIIDEEEHIIKQGKITKVEDLKPIIMRDCIVVIETPHHWISRKLHNEGKTVLYVSGAQSKNFSNSFKLNSIKTDKVDAVKLAWMAKSHKGKLTEVDYSNDYYQEILNYHHYLTQELSDIKRRVESLIERVNAPLRVMFSEYSENIFKAINETIDPEVDPFLGFKKHVRMNNSQTKKERYNIENAKWIRLSREIEEILIERVQDLCNRALTIIQKLNEIENKAETLIDDDEEAKYMEDCPKTGALTKMAILLCLRKTRFDLKKAFAYAGLAPIVKSSGNQKIVKFRYKTNKAIQNRFTTWAMFSIRKESTDWRSKYFYHRKKCGDRGYTAARKLSCNWIRKIAYCIQNKIPYSEDAILEAA